MLVEEGVAGVEVECGVLGNRDPIASVVGEIVAHADWYDYSAKYDEGGMDLVVPARISAEADARVRELAVESFVATECEGMARIDFFVRPDGEVVVNEINTIPGFTSTSVYAKLFEAAGHPVRGAARPARSRSRSSATSAALEAPLLEPRRAALGLRAMPLEPERREQLVRTRQKLVVAARDAERTQGERLHGRPRLGQLRRFPLDPVVSPERDERVDSRREDPRPPDERALDRKLDERLAATPVAALERDPEPAPLRYVSYPSPARRSPSRSSSAARDLVAQAEVREAAEKQVARIAHAWRGEVRVDRSQRAIRLGRERRPVPERVRQLELERDRMDAMVRRQALREAAVELGQASRLVEPADRRSRRRPRLVGLAQVIRIVDPGQQREPLLAPRRCIPEAALVERGLRPRAQHERAELEAVERLGERGRLVEDLLGRTRPARCWPARGARAPSPRSRRPPARAPSTPTRR